MDASPYFLDPDRSIMLDNCRILSRREEQLTATEMDRAAKQIIQTLCDFPVFRGWMIRTLERIVSHPKSGSKQFRRDGKKISIDQVESRLRTVRSNKTRLLGELTEIELSLKFHLYEKLVMQMQDKTGSWKSCNSWTQLMTLWTEWNLFKTTLVNSNLRLAFRLAKKFQGRGLSMAELFQEAVLGLTKCIGNFEVGRRRRVSTFASYWITQAIQGAIATTTRTVRLPHYASTIISRYRRTRTLLAQNKDGHPPTLEDVCKYNGWSKRTESKVKLMLAASNGISLSDVLSTDEDITLEKLLGIQDENSSDEIAELTPILIRQIPLLLDEREELVIKRRFGIDTEKKLSLKEIGEILGITKERVRQIEVAALDKLRAYFNPTDE